MSDINTTPLVDVMLVLLIIFLITVPVVIQTVPVQLAERALRGDPDQAGERQPVGRAAAPGGTCEVYWNLTKVTNEQLLDRAVKKLEDQIKKVGGVENITEENMPEAHIRGDVNTPYKCIGGAVFTMQRAGFARVGFISQPPPGGVTRSKPRSSSPWRCKPPAATPKANR